MTTDKELSEAALQFVEQSDNKTPECLSSTIFGDRGRGYYFEYDYSTEETVAIEWDPFIDKDGELNGNSWSGTLIEDFIGGIAVCAGIQTDKTEIDKVVTVIKLHLPEITCPDF